MRTQILRLHSHLSRGLRAPARIVQHSKCGSLQRHAPFSSTAPQRGAYAPGLVCSASTVEAQAPAAASNGPVQREFKPRAHIVELLRTQDGNAVHVGETVELRGWVRTVRNQKQFCFMQVRWLADIIAL